MICDYKTAMLRVRSWWNILEPSEQRGHWDLTVLRGCIVPSSAHKSFKYPFLSFSYVIIHCRLTSYTAMSWALLAITMKGFSSEKEETNFTYMRFLEFLLYQDGTNCLKILAWPYNFSNTFVTTKYNRYFSLFHITPEKTNNQHIYHLQLEGTWILSPSFLWLVYFTGAFFKTIYLEINLTKQTTNLLSHWFVYLQIWGFANLIS